MRLSKIPLLPPSDLARITVRPREEQSRLLQSVRGAVTPYTYRPLRENMPDVVQASSPMFRERVITPWRTIRRNIAVKSKSPREAIENLRLAKLLYQLATSECDLVRSVEIRSMSLGLDKGLKDIGGRLTFWAPYVFFDRMGPFIPYIEMRRANGCESKQAQRFVHSMMHHAIREADPDLADVRIGILRAPGGKKRQLVLLEPGDAPLYSPDELETMVSYTYERWFEVLAERQAKARRAG